VTKKSDLETSLEILINLGMSQGREATYRGQLEDCNQNLQKWLLKLQDAIKGDNPTIDLHDQRPGSIGELTYNVYRLEEKRDQLEENLDSEIRYSQYLHKAWVDVDMQKVFEKWLEVPFKERRILFHNKNVGFLISFATFPNNTPPRICTADQNLMWMPVPNEIIPDLFCRTTPIDRYKPRDKNIHKADIDTDHFPSEKKCVTCERVFYTFTKTRQYCCDECGSNAYNARRKNRRHEQVPKKVVVKELKLCPICNEEYHGKARTCGKEGCRKAEFRKRKNESL
jgi:hypothetical protein